MVQHELKYQQWLKQYRLGPFYKKETYIISPRDLSRDVLQMCSSFQFLFFRLDCDKFRINDAIRFTGCQGIGV